MKIYLIFTFLIFFNSVLWATEVGDIKVDKTQISSVIDSMVQQGMISAADAEKAKQEMMKMDQKKWDQMMKGAQKAIKTNDPKVMGNLPKVDPSTVK